MTIETMTLDQLTAELNTLRALPASRRDSAVKARCVELADEIDARTYDWGNDYL